jgi:hypothetical protein
MPTMRAADGQKLAEEHLALANRHITQAKERIARQQALIQRIAAAGWAEWTRTTHVRIDQRVLPRSR